MAPPGITRRQPPTGLADTGLHSAVSKAKAHGGRMKEKRIRSGKARAREGQPHGRHKSKASKHLKKNVLLPCPLAPNISHLTIWNHEFQGRVANWSKSPRSAQSLNPLAIQGLPPALAGSLLSCKTRGTI